MASFVRFEKDDPLRSDTSVLEALPWTMEEELVAGHLTKPKRSPPSRSSKVVRFVVVVLSLASLAAPVTHLAKKAWAGDMAGKPVRFAV
jgi:hypothetical protein